MKALLSSQLLRATAPLLAIGLGCLPAQEKPEEESATEVPVWTQTDTRLANHYIQLLQKDPAYGNVLNLLWDLYRKKDQTPLLLDYFQKSAANGAEIPVLIHAHLLRKNDQLDEAREAYGVVLDANGENPHALRALAEISDLQKRFSKALSLYTRLAELVPVTDEEGVAFRLRKAALHRMQGQNSEAVEGWNELLTAYPGREDLRTQIVAQLLEAGETETALKVLTELSSSSDPRQRLDALVALTKLYELISDFDGAIKSARAGLEMLHYKNHDYAELFSRLVQIYERFEKLPELETDLRAAIDGENPTERALYELAEYYRIVANPVKEEEALIQLVEKLPGDMDYRIRLTNTQMRNDRYEAAAETLESALAKQEEYPLHLMLLRAEISLGAEDRVGAEQVVTDFLAEENPGGDDVSEIIEFARKNYLDELVERLLRDQQKGTVAGSESFSAPVELARFLHERGKRRQAFETLDQFVESAGDTTLEKARRLYQVSIAFRELEEPERAREAIEEAIRLAPGNADFQTARADLLVDLGRVEEAIEQLEALWHLGDSFAARADIDQRLFSLMRGHYSTEEAPIEDSSVLKNGTIQSLAQYRRLAAAANRVSRPGDEPPPEELMAYYDDIKKTANTESTTENRYRAAWWAFKLQDNQECFSQLTRATEEAGKPILEVEEMLLELAVLNERPTLMVRHLTTLAEIDPANEDDYLQQRAEKRFELGFEDEAVRELKRLAAKPEASLNTLNTLAKVYQRQGSTNKQVEVWDRAYRNANVFEKRRIVKQLSNALIENGNPQSALEAQLELLQKETDPVQRRRQLDTQLTTARSHFLLEWLLGKYRDLAQQNPFDRFYPEALARVHRAAGEDREAFEAMKKAYYMSGRNGELLDELGQLADSLGDLKSAIYYRRQLLAREEGSSLENWQTLIAMLEKDLRVGEASLLRKRLESRFGRDPEFLSELSDHYRRDGQFADAERALEKLVALRSWDLEARFQLGLLKQERGKQEEAFALFNEILTETEDVEYPEELAARAVPLIQVSTLRPEYREGPGRELEGLIFSVESYPYLGGNLQDDIAEAFQKEHPEFHYLPSEPHLLRLRAMEEAGRIALATGQSNRWLPKMLEEERPLHERLWAARHGGDRRTFAKLLSERAAPEGHAELLLAAWCQLLAGDVKGLLEWARPDQERDSGQHPRSRYAVMASFLLLKDGGADPLRRPDEILQILEELPVHQTVGNHVFSELRKGRDFETASRVGQILANGALEQSGSFLLAVSQVAGWAGHPEEREKLVDRSIALLRETPGSRYAKPLLVALTDRLSLLPSDVARAEFLNRFRDSVHNAAELGESDKRERLLVASIAGRDYSGAIEHLDQLMQDQVASLRPQKMDLDQVRYDQSQSWQRMNQLLHHYSHRIPITGDNHEAYLQALSGRPLSLPTDESVIAEFERFEIDRRILELELLGGMERDSLVDVLDRGLFEPDSSLELAKSLENMGFYRETIPVYRVEAMTRDRDYAPLQGLFEACNEALEPGPALAVINQINAREFPAPPGLTAEYLAEQHARFLLLSRDIERLVPLSRAPTPGKNAPPITTTAHLPYQAALVEAYRVMGRNEALLRLLTYLKNEGQIETRQLLLGAAVLEKQGDFEEALSWIEAVPQNQSDPNLERRALLKAAELQEKIGHESGNELIRLARIGLEHHPASLTRRLADSAFRVGAKEDAIGILRLLRRNVSDPGLQTELSIQLIRMEREKGTHWEDLADEWESFFESFTYEPNAPDRLAFSPSKYSVDSNVGALAVWILEHDSDRKALAKVLADSPVSENSAWFRDAFVAALRDNLEATAIGLYQDSGSKTSLELLETLPSFGEEGIQVARSLVDASALPGPRFFAHQPVRQVTFFHRIGDRPRLLEVHELLMREAESDLFHQTGLEQWFPSLTTRYELPRLFAELEEFDLAARLFRKYNEGIVSYRWNHQTFLEHFAGFLIDQKEFVEAESILKRAFRKSIRVDLRLFPRLYQEWGKLDTLEDEISDLYLSEGRRALLRDWRTALAEGREMVEYSDTW